MSLMRQSCHVCHPASIAASVRPILCPNSLRKHGALLSSFVVTADVPHHDAVAVRNELGALANDCLHLVAPVQAKREVLHGITTLLRPMSLNTSLTPSDGTVALNLFAGSQQ